MVQTNIYRLPIKENMFEVWMTANGDLKENVSPELEKYLTVHGLRFSSIESAGIILEENGQDVKYEFKVNERGTVVKNGKLLRSITLSCRRFD